MKKKVPGIFLIISLTVSCSNSVMTQNRENPSPTIKQSTPESEKKSRYETFIEHYSEGLRIRYNGKYPNDMPNAIEEFKKAAEFDDGKMSYWQIAELDEYLGNYEEAEIYYRKIIEKDSKDERAQLILARLLVEKLKKYDEGLKLALLVRDKDVSDTGFLMDKVIAQAYEGLGDYKNAVRHYKIWMKLYNNPNMAEYKDVKNQVIKLEKLISDSNDNKPK